MDEFGEIDLTHHGGHDVGVLQMEVVVGAIEVGWHHGDIVRAVLQVVRLAHLQTCNLRDGIFLVGIFQGRCQQTVLLHRLGCILGIDAGRTEEEQFLHAVGVGLGDDIALDLHVHHDEVSTVKTVGHDTTYKGGRQHDGVRTFFVEELLHCHLVGQVEFPMTPPYQIGIAPRKEIVPYRGSHQSLVPRHIYLRSFIQH